MNRNDCNTQEAPPTTQPSPDETDRCTARSYAQSQAWPGVGKLRAWIALAVLAVALSPAARASIFHVGDDAACQTSNIQEAIDFAAVSGDEIHIASNTTYTAQSLRVTNKSLSLIGGYSDCSDTEPSESFDARTELDGAGGTQGSVLHIDGVNGHTPDDPFVVRLSNLRITGGDWPADACCDQDGGGVLIHGNVHAFITNTGVASNTASDGGGIYIDGRDPVTDVLYPRAGLDLNGVTVTLNDALGVPSSIIGGRGGGIACFDAEIEMHLGGVSFNEARPADTGSGGRGGGMYLANCRLDGYGLIATENDAGAAGGGIYAVSGSYVQLNLAYDDGLGAIITHNETHLSDNASGGGGIYLSNSDLAGYGQKIGYNVVESGEGGGILVIGDSTVDLSTFLYYGASANRIRGNRAMRFGAHPGGDGGGIALEGGFVELTNAEISGNSAEVIGNAIFVDEHGVASILDMYGTLLTGNGADGSASATVAAFEGSDVTIEHATFADNVSAHSAISATNSDLALYNSVVSEPQGIAVDFNSSDASEFSHGCNVVHDDTNISAATVIAYGNRFHIFRDPGAGNYWPLAYLGIGGFYDVGALVDRCDQSPTVPASRDAHGLERGFDLYPYYEPNDATSHPFDIGAFESDEIFHGVFEPFLGAALRARDAAL